MGQQSWRPRRHVEVTSHTLFLQGGEDHFNMVTIWHLKFHLVKCELIIFICSAENFKTKEGTRGTIRSLTGYNGNT